MVDPATCESICASVIMVGAANAVPVIRQIVAAEIASERIIVVISKFIICIPQEH
jgi:hypothetical protein